MKQLDVVENELTRLRLLKSVVSDGPYGVAIDFMVTALHWVVEESSQDDPSSLLAEQYRESVEKPVERVEKPDPPENILIKNEKIISSSQAGTVMKLKAGEFILPPFPFRMPAGDENAPDYLKWFVGELETYVKNVFGQVEAAK